MSKTPHPNSRVGISTQSDPLRAIHQRRQENGLRSEDKATEKEQIDATPDAESQASKEGTQREEEVLAGRDTVLKATESYKPQKREGSGNPIVEGDPRTSKKGRWRPDTSDDMGVREMNNAVDEHDDREARPDLATEDAGQVDGGLQRATTVSEKEEEK